MILNLVAILLFQQKNIKITVKKHISQMYILSDVPFLELKKSVPLKVLYLPLVAISPNNLLQHSRGDPHLRNKNILVV